LSNEICPEVKLGDYNVFFHTDYISEICSVIPPKLSKEHAHLEQKALTVSWFIGMASQATQNKKLIQP
jgi:hypothetical protein